MCSKPKIPKQETPTKEKEDKSPIILTAADTRPGGQAAAQRRKSRVRLDLNSASTFQGLMIPHG